jgi:aspartate-semialdehyde dehydrogenase
VRELEAQTRAVLGGVAPAPPAVYPHPIAFNVLGGAGNFADGDDYTDEERKMMFETRKILEAPDIGISVTCARVPVIAAHSESVNVQTRDPIDPEAVRALLGAAPGVEVVDDPAHHGYPTALAGAGRDEVLVGRIRRDPSHPRALNLWVVGDNLLKGAATNAIQLAEALHERGLVRVHAPV